MINDLKPELKVASNIGSACPAQLPLDDYQVSSILLPLKRGRLALDKRGGGQDSVCTVAVFSVPKFAFAELIANSHKELSRIFQAAATMRCIHRTALILVLTGINQVWCISVHC